MLKLKYGIYIRYPAIKKKTKQNHGKSYKNTRLLSQFYPKYEKEEEYSNKLMSCILSYNVQLH